MSCDPVEEAVRGALELLDSLGPFKLVGMGTGSTVSRLLERAKGREWSLLPSSLDTLLRAREMGFRTEHVGEMEVYVDSADEVNREGSMIKGGGGAMLGEKVLAFNSPLNVFVVSENKLVETLSRPVPVEVVRDFFWFVKRALERRGYGVAVREGSGKRGAVVSDWGGVILDVTLGPIREPERAELELKSIPGVVETGIFHGLTDYLVVGHRSCSYSVLRFGRRKGGNRGEL
ncbi:MAG: ribose 5-phosphate isomerase A [Acidilobaceae archaeon]|nr:ribose 5-phosphate isomerase A [Acidilobaceae archaeon]MCX8165000.1 ribose 5-phosphate isomerase A [Acidilobaceae archaeon]MDW7974483.1 ribose 5-phosphate isomerase A [Sulfolobales archaeon]